MNLHDLVYGDGFLEMTPNTQMSKEKKIIWILQKLKTFMLQRTLSIKSVDNPQTGINYL